MKSLIYTILGVLGAFLATSAFAGNEAGDDTARHYRTYPDAFDGKKVDVDCAFVTRINGGPQIEGVTFFVAHTVDKDNRGPGGGIVVAVAEEDDDRFAKKYGNTIDVDRGSSDRVDSKRLTGTFHQLAKGHVYIDTTDGAAHELILAHRENAKENIRLGGGPDGVPGKPRKKKGAF